MTFAGMNLIAIVSAAVAAFMFGWVWYGLLFGEAWRRAIGWKRTEVQSQSPSPMPFVISFISLLVMACVFSGVLRHTKIELTVANGLITGAFLWLGFVITTIGTNNRFRDAKTALTVIDGGHWLGVLLLQGAILGAFGP
ncbi:DUF1761 domain-containing protein [Hyphomicrobium sp. D-2]|uniref:DUF1761 domain-containing protein n=1 Tax=Hyphomicrobium sp. D-2 TaxID=3041621 RepID=UPI0024553C36|nr:DUF1761 domain-containing protein [Hyphomicrobium sp. D-2]MDH4983040.1 DUF1761 domain-containing protein [Hyphomicrobium sp. D-2]MDH4983244.1 DUF1761 domain-containing protein [Hyphomicrobium sp. D-2]